MNRDDERSAPAPDGNDRVAGVESPGQLWFFPINHVWQRAQQLFFQSRGSVGWPGSSRTAERRLTPKQARTAYEATNVGLLTQVACASVEKRQVLLNSLCEHATICGLDGLEAVYMSLCSLCGREPTLPMSPFVGVGGDLLAGKDNQETMEIVERAARASPFGIADSAVSVVRAMASVLQNLMNGEFLATVIYTRPHVPFYDPWDPFELWLAGTGSIVYYRDKLTDTVIIVTPDSFVITKLLPGGRVDAWECDVRTGAVKSHWTLRGATPPPGPGGGPSGPGGLPFLGGGGPIGGGRGGGGGGSGGTGGTGAGGGTTGGGWSGGGGGTSHRAGDFDGGFRDRGGSLGSGSPGDGGTTGQGGDAPKPPEPDPPAPEPAPEPEPTGAPAPDEKPAPEPTPDGPAPAPAPAPTDPPPTGGDEGETPAPLDDTAPDGWRPSSDMIADAWDRFHSGATDGGDFGETRPPTPMPVEGFEFSYENGFTDPSPEAYTSGEDATPVTATGSGGRRGASDGSDMAGTERLHDVHVFALEGGIPLNPSDPAATVIADDPRWVLGTILSTR